MVFLRWGIRPSCLNMVRDFRPPGSRRPPLALDNAPLGRDVDGGRQNDPESDLFNAAIAGLRSAADGFGPTKDFFNPYSVLIVRAWS